MKLTRDQALENAIVSCVRNPTHCLYFRIGEKGVAKTYINSNKFYYLPTDAKYERSIHIHELAHTFTSQGLPHEEIILLGSMLDEYGSSEQLNIPQYFDIFFTYQTEITQFLEAIAYLTQIAATDTPHDLRDGMIADLQVHNPITLRLAFQLFWMANRFLEFKATKGMRVDYLNVSMEMFRIMLATNKLDRERVFDRFRLVRETAEDGIPKWGKLSQLTGYLIKQLRRNEFTVLDLRRPMLVVSQAMLWESALSIAEKCGEGTLKPFIFGFLKQIDYTWSPISFLCNNLHTLSDSRVGVCYLHQQLNNSLFKNSCVEALKDLKKVTSSKRSMRIAKKHRCLLDKYAHALHQLKDMKSQLHISCPGPRKCRSRDYCEVENLIFAEINKSWFRQTESLPSSSV